ncbi:hypothetical protein KsCSTR_23200 [Candidatus Kuenenia stuttgartiensis]|uniref:Uncharacterized protein n=1 Tax=Kuenenia stuttgartiensis TaxID=174633 RepID=Q1Q3J6_KUEST|nr:hypothetical protein KsCSTR_23200 [Candidatus Kuenenia stuttgartiensis]CAJ74588.1 unknown protein [Candidatus Kuenenia stuttgartiensis]
MILFPIYPQTCEKPEFLEQMYSQITGVFPIFCNRLCNWGKTTLQACPPLAGD